MQFLFNIPSIIGILILIFPCHAEPVSTSIQLKEKLKRVQDEEAVFVLFIITLYQYFILTEPFNK